LNIFYNIFNYYFFKNYRFYFHNLIFLPYFLKIYNKINLIFINYKKNKSYFFKQQKKCNYNFNKIYFSSIKLSLIKYNIKKKIVFNLKRLKIDFNYNKYHYYKFLIKYYKKYLKYLNLKKIKTISRLIKLKKIKTISGLKKIKKKITKNIKKTIGLKEHINIKPKKKLKILRIVKSIIFDKLIKSKKLIKILKVLFKKIKNRLKILKSKINLKKKIIVKLKKIKLKYLKLKYPYYKRYYGRRRWRYSIAGKFKYLTYKQRKNKKKRIHSFSLNRIIKYRHCKNLINIKIYNFYKQMTIKKFIYFKTNKIRFLNKRRRKKIRKRFKRSKLKRKFKNYKTHRKVLYNFRNFKKNQSKINLKKFYKIINSKNKYKKKSKKKKYLLFFTMIRSFSIDNTLNHYSIDFDQINNKIFILLGFFSLYSMLPMGNLKDAERTHGSYLVHKYYKTIKLITKENITKKFKRIYKYRKKQYRRNKKKKQLKKKRRYYYYKFKKRRVYI